MAPRIQNSQREARKSTTQGDVCWLVGDSSTYEEFAFDPQQFRARAMLQGCRDCWD